MTHLRMLSLPHLNFRKQKEKYFQLLIKKKIQINPPSSNTARTLHLALPTLDGLSRTPSMRTVGTSGRVCGRLSVCVVWGFGYLWLPVISYVSPVTCMCCRTLLFRVCVGKVGYSDMGDASF